MTSTTETLPVETGGTDITRCNALRLGSDEDQDFYCRRQACALLGVLDVVCVVGRWRVCRRPLPYPSRAPARPVAVTASEVTGSALPRLPGAPTGVLVTGWLQPP